MPAPPISIQPVPLHVRQPLPPQVPCVKSISADGSVNGKNDGRRRTPISSPKKRRAKCKSTPFRSAKVTPSSTHSPSTWLNIGECVASSSRR